MMTNEQLITSFTFIAAVLTSTLMLVYASLVPRLTIQHRLTVIRCIPIVLLFPVAVAELFAIYSGHFSAFFLLVVLAMWGVVSAGLVFSMGRHLRQTEEFLQSSRSQDPILRSNALMRGLIEFTRWFNKMEHK